MALGFIVLNPPGNLRGRVGRGEGEVMQGTRFQKSTLAGMKPWLQDRGSTDTPRSRTAEQRAWDSAVFACSEFVRRLTNYDEVLAGSLHLLLTPISEVAEAVKPHKKLSAEEWKRLRRETAENLAGYELTNDY